MKTGVIILAAGQSERMGLPKQLLEYQGTTLLQHTISSALAIPESKIAVVLGANAAVIRQSFDEPRVLVVDNPEWKTGMAGSIKAGLNSLIAADFSLTSVMFLTCDQPLLTTLNLLAIIAAHEQSGCRIAASEYNGVLGIPAVFSCGLFPELLALEGQTGARGIIVKYRDQTIGVPIPEGVIDIDTPSDYLQLRQRQRHTL